MYEPKLSKKELKRKVIVIERTPLGSNIQQVIHEELKDARSAPMPYRKRNPDRKLLLAVKNKWKEELNFCHYKGNNYVNLFISGGVHNMRFMFTVKDVNDLINSLMKIRKSLFTKK